MELPQPPQDQELKNIIDKLAQFVARNGPEFEQMTKTKQKDNPKFSFLFGGDYFNYYQYKVTTEQAILKHRQSREQNANPPQQPQLHPNSMGGYPGSTGPRYNSPAFPYQQQYPPTSSFGGGEGGQYPPPGVIMGNYHQPHPHQYQMPAPPGSEQQHPMTSVQNVPNAPAQNFRPTFPPGDPSYNSSYNAQPNPPEEMYNQSHNVFNPPPPPPTMNDSYSSQPAIMGPPGNDPSVNNSFQQHHGPPLPPTLPPVNDPGPVPVPGGRPASLPNSGPMQSQGLETTMESVNFQQLQLQEQIKQSEQNLEAQRQMIERQKDVQIREGVYMARGDLLKKEANELNLDIQEFEDVLTPITDSCTKDSIANGKHWIFTHAVSEETNGWISQYLLYKSTSVSGSFTHKLHIIYLMNDVLHHCLRKNADGLKDSLERVLAPMYCHAVSSASDDQKAKLDKLLNLWESKMHLEDDLLNQLHTPIESWADYEKELLKDCPQVVAAITLHLNSTFEGYQQQHNAFVQHATSQLQQLEQQKQLLEQQQQQQLLHSAMPPVSAGPPGIPVSYVQLGPHSQHQFMQSGPAVSSQAINQGMEFNQPPPGYPAGVVPPMIDFSKPPPGFSAEEQQQENLVPTVPYFELPAGLMAPLIHIEDNKYKPIDPALLRLPLPAPPSERLLRAVENFYQPPCHERPRNCSEGWEQLALYDYYKAKSAAIKEKERQLSDGLRASSRSPSPIVLESTQETEDPQPQRPFRRYRSISPEEIPEEVIVIPETPRRRSPPVIPPPPPPPVDNRDIRKNIYRRSRSRSPPPVNRYRSPPQNYNSRSPRRSRSRSRSRSSRSRSPSKSRSPSRSRSRSRSRTRSKTRSRTRSRSNTPVRVPFRKSRSRSVTPPSFGTPSFNRTGELDESNKGHQMLRNMGWSGSGLGAKEQGISTPISAAEVRETPQERFRGLGVPSAQSDPFEAFRKNKGQAFINRMKARAEEKH